MESEVSEMSASTDTPYLQIGGDVAVRRLVDRFYDLMDSIAEAATIRAMHPADLTDSRDKLYWFLSGWLGGPQMFVERKGHPRLRARHLPFSIDDAAKHAWMLCMRTAVQEQFASVEQQQMLLAPLDKLADHMRNQP
jgi:hemoglobin